MLIEEILPQELYDTLNSEEFDDEAVILIESVNYTDDTVNITFSLRFDDDKKMRPQLWEVAINGVEYERITRGWSQTLELYKEHILLLEYNDVQTELYFNGTTIDSNNLFIDIFQALMKFSGNKEDILEYTFTPELINELCCQGYGLFARGPKTILEIYAKCLTKYNIKPTFIGKYKPNKALKLLRIGDSYCIGNTFLFKKVR